MSDLQQKDIVSVKDGKKIGKICDIIVNEEGVILYLVVEPTKVFRRGVFGVETNIKFDQITRFGTDVILVDL